MEGKTLAGGGHMMWKQHDYSCSLVTTQGGISSVELQAMKEISKYPCFVPCEVKITGIVKLGIHSASPPSL